MNKYLGLYNTHLEFNNGALLLKEPYVAICKDENHVHYTTDDIEIDYENIPLTFEILGEGDAHVEGDTYQIQLCYDGETTDWVIDDIEYKINDGQWIRGKFGETTIDNLVPGDLVQFRSSIHPYTHSDTSSNYFVNYFSCNTKFNLFGNIESLNGYDGSYQGLDAYQYYRLFAHSNVVSAKHLILGRSDTELASNCYERLFWRSTLIEPPKLPMMNLSLSCYDSMFFWCTNLILPDNFTLPATTLANFCYSNMFNSCTGLNIIPSNLLPATTLANSCYFYMFCNCSGLTTIPNDLLPATTLKVDCYYGMFYDCTGLTVIPSDLLSATSLESNCYTNMFSGCTSLITVPALPATTLANNCYSLMFSECTSLVNAPALNATTLKSGCYYKMFFNCSNLNYIKAMFTTTPSTEYTNAWVYGVSSSGIFVKNSAATWDVTGNDGIPKGWTVQTA